MPAVPYQYPGSPYSPGQQQQQQQQHSPLRISSALLALPISVCLARVQRRLHTRLPLSATHRCKRPVAMGVAARMGACGLAAEEPSAPAAADGGIGRSCKRKQRQARPVCARDANQIRREQRKQPPPTQHERHERQGALLDDHNDDQPRVCSRHRHRFHQGAAGGGGGRAEAREARAERSNPKVSQESYG